MAPTFNSSTQLYSISGSHIKANYGVFSIIVCGVLRLHAVYGTNRIFSEKLINNQFIPNVLPPDKLEHELPIILFLRTKNFFRYFLLVFPLVPPSGLFRY